MSESTSFIKYECSEGIATITLNRPEKLNAFNDEMIRELADTLHRFDMDSEAQVGILFGNGRAFSAGADVKQRMVKSREDLERSGGTAARDAHSSDLLIRSINWKPVISAVHGYAVGMAMGLALESDIAVAETGTKFQITELARGLSAGRYWSLLCFRGNCSFASNVSITGRFFNAEEALAAGVLDYVVPAGTHMQKAREIAKSIARLPPLGVRASVRARRWKMMDVQLEALRQTSISKLYLTEDFAEAARAFTEKRPAGPFKGR